MTELDTTQSKNEFFKALRGVHKRLFPDRGEILENIPQGMLVAAALHELDNTAHAKSVESTLTSMGKVIEKVIFLQ